VTARREFLTFSRDELPSIAGCMVELWLWYRRDGISLVYVPASGRRAEFWSSSAEVLTSFVGNLALESGLKSHSPYKDDELLRRRFSFFGSAVHTYIHTVVV